MTNSPMTGAPDERNTLTLPERNADRYGGADDDALDLALALIDCYGLPDYWRDLAQRDPAACRRAVVRAFGHSPVSGGTLPRPPGGDRDRPGPRGPVPGRNAGCSTQETLTW